MSLMQVLTRDSLQSTTTPYAFLGSSTFIQESTAAANTSDSLYFSSARERSTNNPNTTTTLVPSSDASASLVLAGEQHNYSENSKLGGGGDPSKIKQGGSSAAAAAAGDEWRDHGTQQQQTMNNNSTSSSLQHVAQQSRREKLRIPGSLQHPASPPAGGNPTDHSGGSDLEPPAYGGNTGDMLAVYQNPMSELYGNFSTGAELLNAVSGKNQGYLGDGLPQAPALMGYQGGGFPNSKGWPNGQMFTPATPGTAAGGLSATLLVGSGLQGGGSGSYGSGREVGVGSYMNGPNAQDAMQLYLMNYGNYPDGSSSGGNMVFQINGSASQQQHHLTGIPLQPNSLSQTVTSVSSSPVGYRTPAAGAQGYGSWRNGDELMFMPGSERAKSFGNNQESSPGVGINEFGEYGIRETPSLGGQQHQPLPVENSQAGGTPGYQSLSLTLSSQQPQALPGYDVLSQTAGLESPAMSQDGKRQISGKLSGDLSHFRRDFGSSKSVQIDSGTSAMSASFSIISSSRYLKACQQLLEEVCSVGRGTKNGKPRTAAGPSPSLTSPTSGGRDENSSGAKDNSTGGATTATNAATAAATTTSAGPAVSSPKTKGPTVTAPATSTSEPGESASTLTTEERQEFELKKSKLIAMLQEVDRRYRQYNDQMQVVISSFDAVAGTGSATPYTALALQAMSRYFRCLKDAITGQIQLVCKALGEEDISKQLTTKSPTSRLRFIDQQIRQQRAFQQLGMLNQHAWRPQRGLPERSVSILRAWLFEHFLHPYPKDADKMMLARQTGLTRSQVSNWFINARVRLWKPMVEEMYQEETRDHELDAAVSRMHAENEEAAAAAAAGYHHRVGDAATGGDKLDQQQQSGLGDKSKDLDYVENSDYLRSKQSLNSMHQHPGDSQMYETQQQQIKRSRFGAHENNEMLQLPSSNSASMDVEMKPDVLPEAHHHLHHHHLLPQAQQQQQHGFGYDGLRFNAGAGFGYSHPAATSGGVSLTLGLQHSENNSGLSTGAYRQAFLQHQQQQQQQHDYASFENASLIS